MIGCAGRRASSPALGRLWAAERREGSGETPRGFSRGFWRGSPAPLLAPEFAGGFGRRIVVTAPEKQETETETEAERPR